MWAQTEGVSQRTIGGYELAFAAARRPRTSWQTLGKMLGVNAEDLRQKFEGGPSATITALAVPVSPLSANQRVALRAIAEGARTLAAIRRATGVAQNGAAGKLVMSLKAARSLLGDPRTDGWRITEIGRRQLAAPAPSPHAPDPWRAAPAERSRKARRPPDVGPDSLCWPVLRAVAEGAGSADQVCAATGFDRWRVHSFIAQLRGRDLVRPAPRGTPWRVTEAGAALVAKHAEAGA
jgi:hypothetical protein